MILCVILNNQLLYSSFLVQVICKNYCLTHLELVFSSCTWKRMHMEKNAFILLWQRFRERGWLFDSKYLVVEEKMTMFFMTLSHNLWNQLIKNWFQHLGHIVHRYFHEVLVDMMKFEKEMITHSTSNEIKMRFIQIID